MHSGTRFLWAYDADAPGIEITGINMGSKLLPGGRAPQESGLMAGLESHVP